MLEISREDAMIKRLIEYIILILLTIILFFLYDDEIVGINALLLVSNNIEHFSFFSTTGCKFFICTFTNNLHKFI